MIIQTNKRFKKQLKKLPAKTQEQFFSRLRIFAQDEYHPSLRNHALQGKYSGYRSVDITGDVRALYVRHGSTVVIFAFIGSHSQLYE